MCAEKLRSVKCMVCACVSHCMPIHTGIYCRHHVPVISQVDAAAKSAAEYSARAQPATDRPSLDPEAKHAEANTTATKPAGAWPVQPVPSEPTPAPPQAPVLTFTPPEPKPPPLDAAQPAVEVPATVPRAAKPAADISGTPSSSLMGGLDVQSRIKVRLLQQLSVLLSNRGQPALLQALHAYCASHLRRCISTS